jgi:phosphohistidine phosphatase
MKLYFLRHGIAADVGPEGTGDAGRPLTEEGIAAMRAEARGLRRLGVRLDVLLSSPLVRARQTAEIVARELNLQTELAETLSPGCDVKRLLDLLEAHRDAQAVMVVGHEPDFSDMAGALAGGARLRLKKGGLARVDLDEGMAGTSTLAWLLTPRALREIGR